MISLNAKSILPNDGTAGALVGRYWHDAAIQVDDFQNEGVVASGSWPYQVNTLVAAKKPVASTVPEEGVTGWADTTMLAADAAPGSTLAPSRWMARPASPGGAWPRCAPGPPRRPDRWDQPKPRHASRRSHSRADRAGPGPKRPHRCARSEHQLRSV